MNKLKRQLVRIAICAVLIMVAGLEWWTSGSNLKDTNWSKSDE